MQIEHNVKITLTPINAERAAVAVNGDHVGYLTLGKHTVIPAKYERVGEDEWKTVQEAESVPAVKFRHSNQHSYRVVTRIQEYDNFDLTEESDLDFLASLAAPCILRSYHKAGIVGKRRIFA